ncbi:MAG: NAD(P)-dependent oxidoreductase [Candidatus Heimdallarchaeota archaeon]
MKVLIIRPTIADWLSKQEGLLSKDIELITPKEGTDEEIIELAKDAEIIVCTRLPAEAAAVAKNVKLIQKTGAGVDAIPFETIREEAFVANTSGANPVPMAEGAIALIISLAKRVVQRHNLFPDRSRERGTELRGKNLGIIGLGSIGIEIAKRMQAFEMKILAIKRQPEEQLKKELNLKFLGGPEELDYVMKESDFIVLTIPLTPTTRGIIGEHELRLMKSTSFIVNIGRAALIQEEPLFNALKENQIAGAGLDVWWIPHWWDPIWTPDEDQPAHFPIWELPNVISTPHNVGFNERTAFSDNALKIIAENINRIAQGKEPINQVDKKHQY